ncbi:MAG TPA: carbohydrate binding domain-containing protein, partial [Armatimonadota bacterium]|nr:carbohydrate binding domain-containing protein [Armatimonadota bacterium]
MGCTIASCFIRRPVWCVVVLFIWALATQADGPINLLTNPGFEDNSRQGTPVGWSPFWSRTADAGSMELDGTITHSGKFAIKISHRATTDWSVAAVTSIPVQSGDIMKLSGWMRCEAATNACFSVIARKADNSVISWALGQTTCTEMQGWQYISRRFLVPEECTNIQFRIIGSGPAVLWADDIALSSLGSLQAYTAQKSAGYKAIANRYLQVRLADNCGQLVVTDRRNRRVWTQCSRNQGIVVKKVAIVRPTSMRLTLWDVLNDGEFTATITLVADRPELTVELAGQGHLQNAITFPQPFVTGKG